MAVLYLDFLYPIGHKQFNSSIINAISSIMDIYVLCPRGYYNNFTQLKNNPHVHFIDDLSINHEFDEFNAGRVARYIRTIRIMHYSAKIKKQLPITKIIIASYNTVLLLIWQFGVKHNCPEFIMHHDNIDALENKLRCVCFSLYANLVNHIALEEFIANYLINKFKINPAKITVLPQEAQKINIGSYIAETPVYYCVGLSCSNDEKFIKNILKLQEKEHVFKQKNMLLLKSSIYEYNDGCLRIIKGYIPTLEYQYLLVNAKVICLPFSLSYKYRSSGVLSDAFANNKPVIGSNFELLKYFSKRMPTCCTIFYNTLNFIELVQSNLSVNAHDFDDYIKNHSKNKIQEILMTMLRSKS